MGIWDRDYMRERQRRPGSVRTIRSWSITAILIAINVAAFLIQEMSRGTALGASIQGALYNHPARVVRDWWVWQPLTSAFLHGGFWHLFWNMLFLWWFGRELENVYGRKDYLWFYLLACYIGGLAYAVGGHFYTGAVPSVGASSGVMGVVVLFAFIYPHRRIYIYFLFPVQIWIVAVIYVAGDLIGFLGGSGGGVANAAHLGGAAVGVLFRYYDIRWTTLTRRWRGGRARPARPARRARRARPVEPTILKFEPSEPASPPRDDIADDDRRRMDDILIRIAHDGIDSLAEEEKQFLADMSRKLRDRR